MAEFNADDLTKLHKLGVNDVQVLKLRSAVRAIRREARPKTRKDGTRAHLEAIQRLTENLQRKLQQLTADPYLAIPIPLGKTKKTNARDWKRQQALRENAQLIAERNEALCLLREHLGNPSKGSEVAQDDEAAQVCGPSLELDVMPMLEALRKSAVAAISELPDEQTRTTDADPEPIRLIDGALRDGYEGDEGAYPFRVSRSNKSEQRNVERSSRFKDVADICYSAALGPDHEAPDRAIRAYLGQRKETIDAGLAALEEALKPVGQQADKS